VLGGSSVLSPAAAVVEEAFDGDRNPGRTTQANVVHAIAEEISAWRAFGLTSAGTISPPTIATNRAR
jgi:hypothetical protein